MRHAHIGILFMLSMTIFTCKTNYQVEVKEYATHTKPKNIILLIGDGMGLSQISAALYENKNRHTLEQFPYIGFHKSYAHNNLITDSAAGATAFATGVKTFVGAIGVDQDTLPRKTILEEAEERGLATGLIATSTIVHATPASFIAHVDSREKYEQIALDFLETDIDLFIGGGKVYFDQREQDNLDLYKKLQDKGYYVSDYFRADLLQVRPNPNKKFAFFTANTQPLPAAAGRDYLPFATFMAADYLSKRSEEGFFLMIEGSQIDWGGHAKDYPMVISEINDFNRAIEKAVQFASKHDDTLVIVTADHETGGLALNPGSKMGKINAAFTTNGHTGSLIPVFAMGPGAEAFAGIYENTAIFHKMRESLGFANPITGKY